MCDALSGFLWKMLRELMDKTGSFRSPCSALNLPAVHTETKRCGEDGEVVGTEREI